MGLYYEIHVSNVFNTQEVASLLPEKFQGEHYTPIRGKILNYRETVSSLMVQVDEDASIVENLPSLYTSKFSFHLNQSFCFTYFLFKGQSKI